MSRVKFLVGQRIWPYLFILPVVLAVNFAVRNYILPSGGPSAVGRQPAWMVTADLNDTENGLDTTLVTPLVVGSVVVIPKKHSVSGYARTGGTRLWTRPTPDGYNLKAADGRILQQDAKSLALDVFDPATGATIWQSPGTNGGSRDVDEDTVYTTNCRASTGTSTSTDLGCELTAQQVSDGRVRWRVPGAATSYRVWFASSSDQRGGAPEGNEYRTIRLGPSADRLGLVSRLTGKVLPGTIADQPVLPVGIGTLLIGAVQSYKIDDTWCGIQLTATDAATGRAAWEVTTRMGHDPVETCRDWHLPLTAGGNMLVNDACGRAQLLDLSTGKIRWTAEATGVVLGATKSAALVRAGAETGPVAGAVSVVDLSDGRTTLRVADKGTHTVSKIDPPVLAAKLLVVPAEEKSRQVVDVYDLATGKRLTSANGTLNFSGADWVLVNGLDLSDSEKPLKVLEFFDFGG
jgi:outer membrane protein assembly factor BamB